MKLSNQLTRFAGLWTIVFVASLPAAELKSGQRLFASPEDAIQALQAAAVA